MKITVLGTRGEIPESLPYHAKHSGILIDDQLLIDCGEKSFLNYHPLWIILTHLHPDHAYFVRRGKEESPPADLVIYAPEKPSNPQNSLNILDAPIQLGPYSITPLPTYHSLNVKSQAYLIKTEKTSLLYTGDLVWIDKKYLTCLDKVDLIITEATYLKKGGMVKKDPQSGKLYGHNGIPNLISLLKPFAKQFLFTHFGTWFYEDSRAARQKLLDFGKENDLKILIGYDGLQINL